MKDFYFGIISSNLEDNRNALSYKETCKVALKCGIKPKEDITELEKKLTNHILEKCLSNYQPELEELELIGVFLYEESEQTGEVKDFNGINISISKTKAIIGLSTDLLTSPPIYQYFVFLHELSHLYESKHNEYFTYRLGALMFELSETL